MKLRRLQMALLMVMTWGFITGCETWDEQFYTPQDIITLHDYARRPRLGTFERRLDVEPGKVIYIRRIGVISSANIMSINTVPVGNGYGLKCALDNHGRMLWLQAGAEFNGRRLAFLLDGVFQGYTSVRRGTNPGELLIDVPLSKQVAERISASAEKNHKSFDRK